MEQQGDRFAPIGFGPIAPAWPERRQRLGRYAALFAPSAWQNAPLPEDFDYTYFLVAPPDQILQALRPNELFILENLRPEHPRLVTSLPGVYPRAVVERPGAAPEEIAMVADTLWIDTDRAICTVTFRRRVALRHPEEPGRIGISTEWWRGASSPVPQAAQPAKMSGAHGPYGPSAGMMRVVERDLGSSFVPCRRQHAVRRLHAQGEERRNGEVLHADEECWAHPRLRRDDFGDLVLGSRPPRPALGLRPAGGAAQRRRPSMSPIW